MPGLTGYMKPDDKGTKRKKKGKKPANGMKKELGNGPQSRGKKRESGHHGNHGC